MNRVLQQKLFSISSEKITSSQTGELFSGRGVLPANRIASYSACVDDPKESADADV
jgi:hypothetical protein